ncbi:MAG: hypothetical protein AAFN92_13480 [Bacteroidota bacterium]
MQRLLTCLALPLLLFSCGNDAALDPGQPKPFFDLRAYMDQEIERLEGYPLTVEKSITLNGTTETKELKDLDFKNDLRLFREADINRNAWLDKYTTEEKELSGSHRITTYVAQDSSLQTRRLTVEQDQGVVTHITIDRRTGTVLSDGKHQLDYRPALGYSVRTSQENRFGKDVEAVIEVAW